MQFVLRMHQREDAGCCLRDDRVSISAALSEPRDAIEEIIEPYLIQLGFVQRTPRGRLLTPHAFRHLGLKEQPREPVQTILFDDD